MSGCLELSSVTVGVGTWEGAKAGSRGEGVGKPSRGGAGSSSAADGLAAERKDTSRDGAEKTGPGLAGPTPEAPAFTRARKSASGEPATA